MTFTQVRDVEEGLGLLAALVELARVLPQQHKVKCRRVQLDEQVMATYDTIDIELLDGIWPRMIMNEIVPQDEAALTEIATLLKALGEPNRLRILAELMKGDTCNAELNEALGLAPNLLSHHLRVLSDTGLITSRRDRIDGRWIYYSVDREAAARWQEWFGAFLDPSRIEERVVCGPEGQVVDLGQVSVSGASAEGTE